MITIVCLFLLQTGIRFYLQLQSEDEFRAQVYLFLGLTSANIQASFGNARRFWTDSAKSVMRQKQACCQAVVSCGWHVGGAVYEPSVHICQITEIPPLTSAHSCPDPFHMKPLGDLEESECRPGFNSLPSHLLPRPNPGHGSTWCLQSWPGKSQMPPNWVAFTFLKQEKRISS